MRRRARALTERAFEVTSADPGKRSTGFLIQFLATAVLLLGAFGRIVYSLAIGAA